MPQVRKLRKVELLIVEAYTKYHRTYHELALFYGVSLGTIRNILRRHNVTPRSAGRRPNDGKDLREHKETSKKEHADESTM